MKHGTMGVNKIQVFAAACAMLTLATWLFCPAVPAWAQNDPPPDESSAPRPKGDKHGGGKKDKPGKGKDRAYPAPEQAWNVATIILGCPTTNRISLSLYPARDIEGFIEYGTEKAPFGSKTECQPFKGKVPTQLTLTGLVANTEYKYRLRYRNADETEFQNGPDYRFHTQRTPGSAFVFEIQGDSHPERSPKQNDPVLYAQTLSAVAKDRPDFYMTIGDDFSVDTLSEMNAAAVDNVYLKQVPYLGLVGNSSAIFLVNGNHEQAARCNLDGTANSVAVLAQNTRNKYFPQPAPDDFYTGDEEKVEHVGLLRDYYAWTWGDALFVVIDPYWHSLKPVDNVFGGGEKNRDLWNVTLGDAQYKWFKKTLEESKAKFKFVFTHHVSGTGRGGIEQAGLYEWGGCDKRGESEFAQKRPGWDLPLHQLMVKNKVTIFFQGHDHIFAKQEKDGVIYQTLPDPANPLYEFANKEAYQSGDVFPGSGRVRVSVGPDKVRVEYVRSYLPKDATKEHPDGEIAFSYEIPVDKGAKETPSK
jgi:hypothetical protein